MFDTQSEAMPREAEIKKLTRPQKQALLDSQTGGEMLTVYDAADRPCGARPRRIVHAQGLRHHVCHLWVVGVRDGVRGIWLQKRQNDRPLYPGFYDLTATGHMDPGETPLIAALREMADTMELAEFYDAVCEQTSYVRTLQEKGDMESRGRLENVQELKSNIVSFLENDPEDATLSGFLNEIALYTDLDSATSDNCVTMMTMHSAKGLEFPCVYVVGVEEGIFPGERVRYNDEEVEEERRLCYVAMTRAKERLTMTCTRQRMLFGRTSVSEPSRFLEEVPSENADWVGRQAQGTSGFGDTSFDEGSSYSTRGYGSYGQGAARYDSVMQRRPKSQASQKLAAQKPAASAPLLQLSSGDQIHHKTFGDGLVISVTPMGGDALLEGSFDTVGTIKLMLITAGVHITKL